MFAKRYLHAHCRCGLRRAVAGVGVGVWSLSKLSSFTRRRRGTIVLPCLRYHCLFFVFFGCFVLSLSCLCFVLSLLSSILSCLCLVFVFVSSRGSCGACGSAAVGPYGRRLPEVAHPPILRLSSAAEHLYKFENILELAYRSKAI